MQRHCPRSQAWLKVGAQARGSITAEHSKEQSGIPALLTTFKSTQSLRDYSVQALVWHSVLLSLCRHILSGVLKPFLGGAGATRNIQEILQS